MKMTISHQIKNVGNSLETAYIVQDYPYSFTLRCEKAYWIETKAKSGQRLVTCTKNPKNGKWNKPKASTYDAVTVLYEDDLGHTKCAAVSNYANTEQLEAFKAKWELTEYQAKEIDLRLKAKVVLAEYFKKHPVTFHIQAGGI